MSKQKSYMRKARKSPRKPIAYINKHHLTNACKGGRSNEGNLLHIKVSRHQKLHQMFANMSWEEIGSALKSIFGVSDPKKCIEVIDRISVLKGRTPSYTRSPDLPMEVRH